MSNYLEDRIILECDSDGCFEVNEPDGIYGGDNIKLTKAIKKLKGFKKEGKLKFGENYIKSNLVANGCVDLYARHYYYETEEEYDKRVFELKEGQLLGDANKVVLSIKEHNDPIIKQIEELNKQLNGVEFVMRK